MTKKEAEDYLRWYDDKVAEHHYLASFPSSRPFIITYPDAPKKREQALIVLGKHQFQRTYEQNLIAHPTMPREYYDKKRKELGLD